MVRIGLIIVVGVLMASMGSALYAYTIYQPVIKTVDYGKPVRVGPVEYVITYEKQFDGDKDIKPEHTFFQIRIDAKNLAQEPTPISGIQFVLIDENGTRSSPVHGGFSSEDLLFHTLTPQNTATFTTQFDIPVDEDATYYVGIQPRKEQSSRDIGNICVLNC